jgi:hypothetical protein
MNLAKPDLHRVATVKRLRQASRNLSLFADRIDRDAPHVTSRDVTRISIMVFACKSAIRSVLTELRSK